MQFVVRANQSPNGLEGAFRIHVHPDHLRSINVEHGELCDILGGKDGTSVVGCCIAWRAADSMSNAPRVRPAKTTDTLRTAFSIQEGSHISLTRSHGSKVNASKVVLTDVTPDEYVSNETLHAENSWRTRCAYLLVTCEAFAVGHTFEISPKKGVKKRYHIERVDAAGSQSSPRLFIADDSTEIVIASNSTTSRPSSSDNAHKDDLLSSTYVGGLVEQLQTLNKSIEKVLGRFSQTSKRIVNQHILLHGYEGTGKSLLLEQIEQHVGFKQVLRVDRSKTKATAAVDSIFNEALNCQPSLIIVDNLQEIAPVSNTTLGSSITAGLARIAGSRVLLVAACPSPNDVDHALLGPRALSHLIELPIPDEDARYSILQIELGRLGALDEDLAMQVSARTHGFTGKDLAWLVLVACRNADDRNTHECRDGSVVQSLDGAVHSRAAAQIEGHATLVNGESDASDAKLELTTEDFDFALTKVRPTALREMFFEKPRVRWSDIGGSQDIRRRFDDILGRPLNNPQGLAKYQIKQGKGILLYGPPGCSKTLTAQAVANSYSLNFIVVKGGELISMYVGESERAVREIFRKAKAAAPCVIFFDEIDSIASDREAAGTKGLNVLTTLLNEMDGFETLKGVLVLAATNKPNVLDPAIMRPGRFDDHVYIGLPNQTARSEIIHLEIDGIPLQDGINVDALADAAEAYSGAEVVEICQRAKKTALSREEATGVEGVSMGDFSEAIAGMSYGITESMLDIYRSFQRKEQV